MKRIIGIVLVVCVLFSGCNISEELEPLDKLRGLLRQGSGLEFDVRIWAEYVDTQHSFLLHCAMDTEGVIRFEVLEPESIKGVAGTIDETGGSLTYDGVILTFPLLADGTLSPVCAPWFLLRSINGGLIRSVSNDSELYGITFDESFRGEAFQVELQLSADGIPVRSEIFWEGLCIVKMDIESFRIL